MAMFMYINGIPGSGKSHFRRAISNHYKDVCEVVNLNDYPILLSMAMEERTLPVEERQFRLREEGGTTGFDIRDRRVLSLALDRLAAQASQYARKSALVLIEFARTSYVDVWDRFPLMENALFFFMHTPYDICMERIQRRVLRGRSGDDRPISEGAMSNYLENGFSSWMKACHDRRRRVLDNSGDWNGIWTGVRPYLDEVVYPTVRPVLWFGADLKAERPSYQRFQWESEI